MASTQNQQQQGYTSTNSLDYANTMSEKTKLIADTAISSKNNSFFRQINDLGHHYDMTHNATYYKERNSDVLKAQEENLARINNTIDTMTYNKDIGRRQVEINNWYFEDKLETLFFLQVFFMTMLAMSIIFYLQKSSIISAMFAGSITFVLLLVTGLIGLFRYIYTRSYRDSRWWYKRRFNKPVYTDKPKCGCVEDPHAPDSNKTNKKCPAKTGDGPCMSNFLHGLTKTKKTTPQNNLERVQKQILRADKPVDSSCFKSVEEDKPDEPCEKEEDKNSPPGSTNVSLNNNVLTYL
jgi:hypothetical protein